MAISDVEQRLMFLDQEHRRERADLDKLRATAKAQAAELASLGDMFNELVDEVKKTQAQLAGLTSLEQAMTQLRAELVRLVEAQGVQTRGELERLREQDMAGGQRIAAVAKTAQAAGETVASVQRQLRVLQDADTQHGDRVTHLAESVQELHDSVTSQAAGLERVRPQLDTHTAETANLYRLIQGLEERLTGAQALGGEMRERVQRQDEALVAIGRSLQTLRADLIATQSQLVKFPQIEQALQNAKDEIMGMVRDYRAQHQKEFERATQERLQDRQNHDRAIGELNRALEAIPPIQERLSQQDREAARLNTLISQVDARLLDLTREVGQNAEPLPFLNEQLQKHDGRLGLLERDVLEVDRKLDLRVAPIPFLDESILGLAKRMDVVEAALPPHDQRLDTHQARLQFLDQVGDRHATRLDTIEATLPGFTRSDTELLEKVDFLEDWVQRTATRLDEVQRFEDELRKTLAEVVEAEKVRDTHREQRLAAWDVELVEHRKVLEDWKKVLRAYEDHHQGVTRQMQEMRELGTQLDQQQKASIEAQRIEAEKVRREVAEWRQDVDKRWTLFFKQRDWDWQQQKLVNEAHAIYLAKLEQWRSGDIQSVAELAERVDSKDRELLMRIEDLWEVEETALQRRLGEVKAWLAEVQESKTKSPKPRVPKPGEKIIGTDPRYRKP